MSLPAETWFSTTVADSPTLRALLVDIRDHVRRARLCRRLDPEARIYAVTEPDYVRLWVNQPALEGLDVFRRVTLQADRRPGERERVNALIEGDESEAFVPVPAARQAQGGAQARR